MDNCNKIYNPQLELIKNKTHNLLLQINCPNYTREKLQEVIVQIVYKNSILRKKKTVLEVLKIGNNKTNRVILYEIQKELENIVLDENTRTTFLRLGIKEKVTSVKFIKAFVKEIELKVQEEKKSGFWLW